MAKTTSSTKAKTKTSNKKPTTKAAAKTTKPAAKSKSAAAKATKTSAKTTAAASAQANKTKVTIRRSPGRLSVLRRPHMLVAGLFTALAVAAGLLMNTASAQVLLGHLAKDELASRASTALAPAAHVLYEAEFRWLLVTFLAAAAILALLRATRYLAVEEAGVTAKVQPVRWADFAITGALAFEIAALLNGLQDAVALKLAMASIVIAAILGWAFERENAATNKPARVTYIASLVAIVLPVLALLTTVYANYMYGLERSPWYAYAAAAVVSLWLVFTVRLQWNVFKRRTSRSYAVIDRTYNRLAFAAKVALALILIVGLYDK